MFKGHTGMVLLCYRVVASLHAVSVSMFGCAQRDVCKVWSVAVGGFFVLYRIQRYDQRVGILYMVCVALNRMQ